MILVGHVASIMIASRGLRLQRSIALAAALFPDALDKGLHWIAQATPSDRLWGHTAWAVALTTVGAWLVGKATRRPGVGRSWLGGYLVHLLGDAAAPLALFYPLSRRGYRPGARIRQMLRGERRLPWNVLIAEGLLALAAGILECRARSGGEAR